MPKTWWKLILAATVALVGLHSQPVLAAATPVTAAPPVAVSPDGDFSIQVSPSPLVASLKPGTVTDLEIQIRNSGSQTEALKIEPRSFTVDNATEEVRLNDSTAPEVAGWLSFNPALLIVPASQVVTEKLRIKVPADAGFSYSFALVISRQKDPSPAAGRSIKGSLAIFTLLNIDKPGASRKLDVAKFTVSKRVYEYLPADLSIELRNSGNTIVQPYGNIYLQRGLNDNAPLATLPVNDKKGYILPGSTRTLESSWSNGFPAYRTITASNGSTKRSLVWDWSKAANFRIGKYTAKLVAVYNDGSRDVPIEGNVSFWVIPWKILGVGILIMLLILFAIGSVIWRVVRLSRRRKRQAKSTEA